MFAANPWTGPHGLPDFAAIDAEALRAAFGPALERAEAEIRAIAGNPAPPSVVNTIDALELSGDALRRAQRLLGLLAGAEATDAVQALQAEIAPRLAAFHHRVATDESLFARIDALWSQRETLDLTAEQARVLDLTRRDFLRAGAGLGGAARARLGEIAQRLAALGVEFGRKVLDDEKRFALAVAEDVAARLPADLRDAMRAAAEARGQAGHVATLARSSVEPFLTHCPDRALREAALRAWAARGTGAGAGGPANDTAAEITETLALRREKAALLGYADFPAFRLEPQMAGDRASAEALLVAVWEKALPRAQAEAQALEALIAEEGAGHALEGWDWRYYAEKLRARDHALSDAAIKPYLALDAMIAAAFDVAGRLFGLHFAPVEGATLWAKEARAWRVSRDGAEIGVFIGDYFARETKRSGAWCGSLQVQSRLGGAQAPIVYNVCNFARAGDRDLLSLDDAETLFHEFGHALHGLLSDVAYPSVSGLAVARDFVELPSQLFERWLDTDAILAAHARNEAGEAMPAELIARIRAAARQGQGFATVEYCASALVDLHLHGLDSVPDPRAEEAALLRRIGMPEAILPRHAVSHFQHVFQGEGYAAGYYAYLWSEVMDADAFAAFDEAGDPFDAATARRLEAEILSRGGSVPAEAAWRGFRGRDPDPAPMLRARGLVA